VTQKQSKHIWIKIVTFLALILVSAAILVAALELSGVIHLFHKSPVVRAPEKPLVSLPMQKQNASSINSNDNTSDPSSGSDGVNQGNDTDRNGRLPSGISSNPSDWSTSASDLITDKTPQENGIFTPSAVVAGTASVGRVQYTLIDSQLGVISQGFINVVNNNFSAAVNFSSHTSTGRLDLFSTDANGKELNEVQVDVKF
jgi:hypothetical protein